MDHAVVALAERRFIERLDTGAQCHLLASLIAQGEQCVVEGVGLARDDQASLASLGRLLGVTATVARQRYAPTARAGRTQPSLFSESRP